MLKKLALNSGFDLVAATNAEPMSAARKFLDEWIKAGFHGDMDWLERDIEKRVSPKQILAGAESVIMLAKNYYTRDEGSGGYIAKYARFRDYHREMSGALKKMISTLEEKFSDHKFKHYVDYGPLLEKGFALKTGMGFVGKNTTLITKDFGSWVLLSEIITTVPVGQLAHKNPKRSYENCGSCTRCLDNCPTGALVKPYIMDAKKCISYLTIENKGGIPVDLRPKIGSQLFGCDICQSVCPFNKALPIKPISGNWQRKNPSYLHPNEILRMRDEEVFKMHFAGTPLMRAKFRGMVRNACVVSGNLRLIECKKNLQFWQSCEDEMLAGHAKWALKQITVPSEIETLALHKN